MSDNTETIEGVVDEADLSTENVESEQTNHEPPEGSKRWNQIYKANKEKDRMIDSLQREMTEFKNSSNQTNTLLQNFISNQAEDKYERMLGEAENQLRQAREEGDDERFNAAISAYGKINKARTSKEAKAPVANNNVNASVNSNYSDQDFTKDYPWYETNSEMTKIAHRINSEMQSDSSYQGNSNKEFLSEVARRTTNEFYQSGQIGLSSTANGLGRNSQEPKNDSKSSFTAEEKALIASFRSDLKPEEALKKHIQGMKNK